MIVDFLNVLVRAFHASPPSAINGVRGMLETISTMLDRLAATINPEYLVFALDGGYRARTALLPSYKSHRGPKPAGLAEQIALGERVLQALGWPAIRVDGWEADDVIASLATQLNDIAAGVVIVSCDKDLVQLLATTQSMIHHPWKGGSYVNAATCLTDFGVKPSQLGDYLALVGDTSDGVPGVTGIGPKKAAELLSLHGTLEKILEAARCLLVPGAAGKMLRDQADAARLSRQLVTLRTDLPVGAHWQGWPLAEPRAGWKAELVTLGLGGPAQRLKLPDGRGRQSIEASQITVQMIGGLEPAIGESDRPIGELKSFIGEPHERFPTGDPAAEQRDPSLVGITPIVADDGGASRVAATEDRPIPGNPPGADRDCGRDRAVPLTRRGYEHVKSPDGRVFPGCDSSGLTLREEMAQIHAIGQRSRQPSQFEPVNPWPPGGLRYEAWQLGHDGEPLDCDALFAAAIDTSALAAAPLPARAPAPKPRAKSLFLFD